jgi:hypothetical protein
MDLDAGKLYIKIVALDVIYNFVVEKIFILKLFRVPKIVLSSRILKF